MTDELFTAASRWVWDAGAAREFRARAGHMTRAYRGTVADAERLERRMKRLLTTEEHTRAKALRAHRARRVAR